MNYLELLEESYEKAKEVCECPPQSRLEFLSEFVFNFVTYNPEASCLFACKALEVCKAITEGGTRGYCENESNYMWYLLMCNTWFFYDKLDWGTSIRNAFWRCETQKDNEIRSSCFWHKGRQIYSLRFKWGKEWVLFIGDLIKFASSEMTWELSRKGKIFI